jgi:L-malate glycosyltransferase
MRLSVLHVLVPEPPGELGGADLHLLNLAQYQVRSGCEVTLIERGSQDFVVRASESNIDIISETGQSIVHAIRELARAVALKKPDIVHAHGYDADYWLAVARICYRGCFRNSKIVFTQHGIVEDTPWHKVKTLLDVLSTRSADGIIVCAETLIPRIKGWAPSAHVRYIPNGVVFPSLMPRLDARTTLGLPHEAFLVGYVGRLSNEKRPDRVIQLISDARKRGLPVEGVIAGSGRLLGALVEQAENLGIRDRVHFAGLVKDMGCVYSSLDALVLLSDTETTSRVVIEAMASRVPVIASSVGGVPQLLDEGKAGYLVPPRQAGSALNALINLYDQPNELVDRAFVRAIENYEIGVMGSATAEFYKSLL